TPPRVPDEDNAAVVYQEAFDLLTPDDEIPNAWKERWSYEIPRGWRRPEMKDGDVRAFVAAQSRGLERLRKAAAMPRCAFDHDYSETFMMRLPEQENLLRPAALLAPDAAIQADDGPLQPARRDVAAILGIARHANEPVLICLL